MLKRVYVGTKASARRRSKGGKFEASPWKSALLFFAKNSHVSPEQFPQIKIDVRLARRRLFRRNVQISRDCGLAANLSAVRGAETPRSAWTWWTVDILPKRFEILARNGHDFLESRVRDRRRRLRNTVPRLLPLLRPQAPQRPGLQEETARA